MEEKHRLEREMRLTYRHRSSRIASWSSSLMCGLQACVSSKLLRADHGCCRGGAYHDGVEYGVSNTCTILFLSMMNSQTMDKGRRATSILPILFRLHKHENWLATYVARHKVLVGMDADGRLERAHGQ